MMVIEHLQSQKTLRIIGAIFFSVVFLTGGASRGDVTSLLFLRPFCFLVLILAAVGFVSENFTDNRTVFLIILGLLLWIMVQLIPLPPSLWMGMPGRGWMGDLATNLGFSGQWYPISFVPNYTINSLYSLIVPVAGLMIASRMNSAMHKQLLALLLIFGVLAIGLGFLQLQTSERSSFYLYSITNKGSFVGSFANRNHLALFLAMLMAMVPLFVETSNYLKKYDTAKPAALLLLMLILFGSIILTASRAGVLLALIALVYAVVSAWRNDQFNALRSWTTSGKLVAGGFGFVVAVGVIVMVQLSEANGISRILSGGGLVDLRFQYNPTVWAMIWDYFPTGIGFGNFPYVFAIHEPDELLNLTYLNHAHNDLFEFLLEGGAFSMLLLIAGLWFWVSRTIKILGMPKGFHRRLAETGSIVIFLIAVSSLFDYPARTPMIATMVMIAAVWLGYSARERQGTS